MLSMDIIIGESWQDNMYKIGMYGGCFNPVHLGHVNAIIEASSMCEKLYVVLSSTPYDEIPKEERYMWLKQITKDMDNVEVVNVIDNSKSKKNYNWSKGKEDILNIIQNNIDIVFAGNDYKGTNYFESLYENVYYFDREEINISSSQIRNDPFKYYDYLPEVVKPYYNKKVVIIGTESCGKSTLVRNLAKSYNTVYVEEVGRDICDEAGGIDNMQPKHFIEILFKHKQREIDLIKQANKVLFIDTEAIVTLYYYRLLFKEDKNFTNLVTSIVNTNNYDKYVFLEPDVKWVQDGTRTYGEDEIRIKNNNNLKQMFNELNIEYTTINGNYHERYIKTKKLINDIIK
jgi:HTH-type transcriptional regulator, transcriptional repressor of NAD biosynthesis genes